MEHAEMLARLEKCTLPAWETLPDFGLYMDQLVTYVGKCFQSLGGRAELTPSMINNYVKSGLIARPAGKKYSRESLAQLLMISLLKPTTPLDVMHTLLHPAAGEDTESVYAALRGLQAQTLAALAARPDETALGCALEAASLHMILRFMTEEAPIADSPADGK